MLERLGNVIYWLCCALAPLPLVLVMYALLREGLAHTATDNLIAFAVGALGSVIVWLVGRAGRYVLAGM